MTCMINNYHRMPYILRWYPDICKQFANQEIDTVYFDNTYSRKSAKFMTRDDCKQQAAEFCKLQIEANKILYFVLESIGKEDILQFVAESLGSKIVVPKDKFQLVKCMGLSKYFTVDEKDGELFFLSKTKFNYKKSSQNIIDHHSPKEVVFVKITGMRRGQNCEAYKYINFSEHSSMKEIERFFDSLIYKSATPILTRIEKSEEDVKSHAKRGDCEKKDKKQESKEKVKVKLRKNKSSDDQTSFTIFSEFERSRAVTPRYRVVTGVSTDEEAGDSPGVVSPTVKPTRSCSTPLLDVTDEDQFDRLVVFHDQNSVESTPSMDANEQLSISSVNSPSRIPYIEPPIDLDWVLSPIKSSQAFSSPEIDPSKVEINDALKIDPLNSVSSDSSIEVLVENEFMDNLQKKSSPDKPHGLSPCDVGLICNSPIYEINGKVSYLTRSPTIEREFFHDFSNGSSTFDDYESNVGQLYEEMFRETEVPPEITASLVNDLCDDILNTTPNSVDTLHVSDTESESGDEMQKDGPIGDYLRGQYALNQMFNNSVIDIRESFSTSAKFSSYPQRTKKSTEEDLAKTKIELLMPKMRETSDAKPKKEYDFSSTLERVKQLRDSKEEYFRNLSEIAQRGYHITYSKKPRKIGKSLPQNLLSESMNLINNYAEKSDGNVKSLARKLTYDDTFHPRNKPVLAITKISLTPGELHHYIPNIVHNSSYSHATPLSFNTNHILQTCPVSPSLPQMQYQASHKIHHPNSCTSQMDLTCIPSPEIEILGHTLPICNLRSQVSSKTRVFKKHTLKQNPRPSSSIVPSGSRPRQKSTAKSTVASNPPEDIFDFLFGSTPTSAVKRVKKRSKEQGSSCKRGHVRPGNGC